MAPILGRAALVDTGLLVLRISSGLMMAAHGWGKAGRVLSGEFGFADPLGIGQAPSLILAAFAEFVCALLVVVGLKTRWAAVPVVITMLVAGLVHHAQDPWSDKESALLFAAMFLALVLTGGGRWSVDTLLGRRKG